MSVHTIPEYRPDRRNITRDKRRAIHDVTFIGVDGEGVGPDYVMLSVGDETLHNNGKRLTHADIFPFLYAQYKAAPLAVFCGFALTYDFTMWLKGLTDRDAYALYDKQGIAARRPRNRLMKQPFPVRRPGGEWEFDLMGNGRRFRLRPNSRKYDAQGWLYVCDVFGYWQTSFLSAIDPAKWQEPVCTPEEYALIREGKLRRNTAGFDEAMRIYNVTENRVLARMMRQLNLGLVEAANVRLKRAEWFGPGQAAQKWLGNVQAPRRLQMIDATPGPVRNRSIAAYYGGWFENMRHGIQPGATHSYDLISAYPAIIATLPCLLHGEWKQTVDRKPGAGRLALVYGLFKGADKAATGPLPYRTKEGHIQRPVRVKGTYWLHEIEAAERAGLLDGYTPREVWTYKPGCRHAPPLRAIRDLYQRRLSVDKGSPQGKALKLIMNSVYGKTAQTVGEPMFSNMLYAGIITSLCRARILDAIATHPKGADAVLMVNTDGIAFDAPHPTLPLSDTELGLWEHSIQTDLCLFMPGVYWELGETKTRIKRRGMPLAAAEYLKAEGTRQFAMWTPGDPWPRVEVTIPWQFVTGKLAYSRGKWHTAGTAVIDGIRAFDCNPYYKRYPIEGTLTSRPYSYMPGPVSTPYDRGAEVFGWIEAIETEEYQSEEWQADFMAQLKPEGGI